MPVAIRGAKGIELGHWICTGGFDSVLVWGAGVEGNLVLDYLIRITKKHRSLDIFSYDSNPESRLSCQVVNSLSELKALATARNLGIILTPELLIGKTIKDMLVTRLGLDADSMILLRSIKRRAAEIYVADNQSSSVNYSCMGYTEWVSLVDWFRQEKELWYVTDVLGKPDPLLNPFLGDMLRYSETVFPSRVITPLLDMDSNEQWLSVEASAISTTALVYVPTRRQLQSRRQGAVGRDEIARRFRLLERYGELRRETSIRVLVEDCSVTGDEFEGLQHLARTYGLTVIWSDVHPNYDNLLARLEYPNTDRMEAIRESRAEVPWDLDSYLEAAELQKEKDCLCQRVFPVVGVGGELRVCHLYENPILDESVISKSFQAHESNRAVNSHCSSCQQYGLHRLDKSILDQQLNDKVNPSLMARLRDVRHK